MKKMLDKVGMSQGAGSGAKSKRSKSRGNDTATGASSTTAPPKADILSHSMVSKNMFIPLGVCVSPSKWAGGG